MVNLRNWRRNVVWTSNLGRQFVMAEKDCTHQGFHNDFKVVAIGRSLRVFKIVNVKRAAVCRCVQDLSDLSTNCRFLKGRWQAYFIYRGGNITAVSVSRSSVLEAWAAEWNESHGVRVFCLLYNKWRVDKGRDSAYVRHSLTAGIA